MKKAFLVVGAESSGTKLVTQILANHGCYGQNENVDNEQIVLGAMEKKLPLDADPVVVRLSMPHGLVNYDIENFIWHLHCIGYKTMVIVTVRDWNANMGSQCHEQTHALAVQHSNHKLQKAYKDIFRGLIATDILYFMVTYEALLMRHKDYAEWIIWKCRGFSPDVDVFDYEKCPKVTDQNAKWYK